MKDTKKVIKLISYITDLAEDYFLIEAGTESAIINLSKEDKDILYNCFHKFPTVKECLNKHDKLITFYGELFVVDSLPKNRKPIITPKR